MGEEVEAPTVFEALTDDAFSARETVFKQLFAGCSANDAKQIAKDERGPLPDKGISGFCDAGKETLTYAEVDMKTMRYIIEKISAIGPLFTGQGSFVDLGSGAGKAAMAAGLLGPWAKVTGVEFLGNLHTHATKSVERLEANPIHGEIPLPTFSFLKGDFSKAAVPLAPECTCALAVATMYQQPQLDAMSEFAKVMPKNSFFITFSQKLTKGGDDWELVFSEQMNMGWGPATLFIFKNMPPPEIEAEVEAEEGAAEAEDPDAVAPEQ